MPSRVNRKWQNGDSDSSFNSSKNSDHHEVKYSRMSKHRLLFSAMSSPRKSRSLFDKTFNRPNASMSYNKITKISRRPRVSEVERCTNITQREQYKLLIEQYRKNSLAETAKIFCKNQNFAKLEPTTIKEMPIIDLSETDTSPAPVAPQPSSNTSFQTSTVKRFPPTQAHRMPPKPLERISQSTSPINGTKQVTPIQMSHPKIDWFSPSSPYLCKNFVSDLIGTYGRRERDRKRI
uniref:Uncharacterized protein n=1 Tax=Ciona savignyi TaxID=51511 RepID=H2Y7Z3_CIOSA